MPPKVYPPLTAAEKKAILDRHAYLVEEMNKYLPDEQKVEVDKDLAKRLEDPKQVAIYRIGQEMEQLRNRQHEIRAQLEERFGAASTRDNPLTRALDYAIDTSGTPEANDYNEKLYQDYLNDPDKIIYERYGKVMNTNPKELYDCNDDPLKMAEYYRDTYPLCEEGFNFNSVMRNGAPSPQLNSALKSIARPMEAMSYPCTIVRAAAGIDSIACPKLTAQQSALVQSVGHEFVDREGESLRMELTNAVNAETEQPASVFPAVRR